MPRPLRRRSSNHTLSDDDDSDYGFTRRHASPSPAPRGRRAASLSAGKHPGLDKQHSYYGRDRSRRNYRGDSSDSDDDDHRYHRHTKTPRSGSRSRAGSPDGYRPSSRSLSVDYYNHHDRDEPRASSRDNRHESQSTSRRAASAAPSHSKTRGYYPPSASRSNTFPKKSTEKEKRPPRPRRSSSAILLGAGRTAFEAGAVAALKLRDDPGPWIGPKGAKIAAAALSAAAVDTYMEQKHPKRKGGLRHTVMRQATQLVIGNLVMKPAASELGRRERVKEGVKDGLKEGVKEGVKDGMKDKVRDGAKRHARVPGRHR